MKCIPMVVVKDVEAAGRWYAELLDAQTPHGGNEFEMVMKDDEMLLFLHHANAQEHPAIVAPTAETAGSGVLLYIYADDVDEIFARARAMGANLLDEPHENKIGRQYEFSLRDPEGYALTVARR